MDIAELARLLPKVDVHSHFLGAIDEDTALSLVARNTRGITTEQVRAAYDLEHLDRDAREPAFYDALDLVGYLLNSPADLEAAVYGLVAHDARESNLRYVELSVNTTALVRSGMSFRQVREGLIAGARSTRSDFGVTTRFIAAIMRDEPVSSADELVDDLIENPTDEFLGIGLDGPEALEHHRAGHFVDVFQRAKRNGLRRTAHYCQFGPSEFEVYTDGLECERIDHGYQVIEDPSVLQQAITSDLPFTVCPTITQVLVEEARPEFRDGSTHPLRTMEQHGLWIVPGTDDEAMIRTSIATEYALTAEWCGWDADDLLAGIRRSVDATWLDEAGKADLRSEIDASFAQLTSPRPS